MAASRDATVMLGSVGPLLSQRNYSEARNILDELLEQCVATGGSGASGSSDARSQQGSFRYGLSKRPMLHPMHTVAFNAHAQLVNCVGAPGPRRRREAPAPNCVKFRRCVPRELPRSR